MSENPVGSREGRGGLPNLFISPFGEPFRAPPGAPYPVGAWFAGADRDHDGRLSRSEFRLDAERFFRMLDGNHDGVIDGFEIAAYERAIAPEILPRVEGLHAQEGWTPGLGRGGRTHDGRGGGKTSGGMTQGAGVFSLLDEPEPVSAADTDLNGRVSFQEMIAAADRRFALLDVRKYGYLTLANLPRTPVQAFLDQNRRKSRLREH